MKILVVSPPTFGKSSGAAAKDTFATIELLKSLGHDVELYAIGAPGQHEPLISSLSRTHGVLVHIFMPQMKSWGDWLSKVFFTSIAYADRAAYVFAQLIENPEFIAHVDAWKPDTILFFCSYGWPVAQFARGRAIPTVFRSHNYEASFFWESLTLSEMLSPFNWIRYAAKRMGEKKAVLFASVTATLPFEEIWRYKKWKPQSIFVFTLTFVHEGMRPAGVHAHKKPLDVFYLGASYLVSFHLRGARALIEDIAPEIERLAPGAFRFHICGSKLPADLQKKCDGKSVVYEGYVEDFEAFMGTMDIGAFPVWTGKVMKGKVFESLGRAFPVVIPHNCLGGYTLQDTREVLMAETPQEFVQAILRLKDDTLREALSVGAAAFASQHFSKEILMSTLRTILSVAAKNG